MTVELDPTDGDGYQLTATAEAELGDILGLVAERDGVHRALRVPNKFVKAFEFLASQPGSGRTRPKLTGDRIRWWPLFKWLVIYDPVSPPVSILRVIHGARELDRLFESET